MEEKYKRKEKKKKKEKKERVFDNKYKAMSDSIWSFLLYTIYGAQENSSLFGLLPGGLCKPLKW